MDILGILLFGKHVIEVAVAHAVAMKLTAQIEARLPQRNHDLEFAAKKAFENATAALRGKRRTPGEKGIWQKLHGDASKLFPIGEKNFPNEVMKPLLFGHGNKLRAVLIPLIEPYVSKPSDEYLREDFIRLLPPAMLFEFGEVLKTDEFKAAWNAFLREMARESHDAIDSGHIEIKEELADLQVSQKALLDRLNGIAKGSIDPPDMSDAFKELARIAREEGERGRATTVEQGELTRAAGHEDEELTRTEIRQGFGDVKGMLQAPRRPARPPARFANLPNPSSLFTGRDDLLSKLHQALQNHSYVALTGIGGIGKTEAAIQYAHAHAKDYKYRLFTAADTRDSLLSGYAEIARGLHLPTESIQDRNEAGLAVKRWLEEEKNTRWLLVADNVENIADIQGLLPMAGPGRVLLSRRSEVVGGRLDSDDLDQASPKDREAGREICNLLGGLPLALDQAGAYMEQAPKTPAGYLDLLKTNTAALLRERGGNYQRHEDSVWLTFTASFDLLESRNPAAADLLRLCSMLGPYAIPEEIFIMGAPHLGDGLGAAAANPLEWDHALMAARDLALIHRAIEPPSLSLHRLVQQVIRERLSAAERRLWMKRAIESVNAAFPNPEFSNWPFCDRLLPHAMECAWRGIENLSAARLLICTAYCLSKPAQYAPALYRNQGNYAVALLLYERALAMKEKALGPKHPDTARSLSSLANHYRNQGNYAAALPLYERALAIYEKARGPEHPHPAMSMNLLANLYSTQGEYALALRLYEQALPIREKVLVPEHPDTARSLSSLANHYRNQGNYAAALPLYERALAISEKALGPEHPDMETSLNNLANLYSKQGNYAAALPLYERALAISEKARGPEHPYTKWVQENLRVCRKEA